jgi:hypothetical protein
MKKLLFALIFLNFIPTQCTKFHWIGTAKEAGQYKVTGALAACMGAAYLAGSAFIGRDYINHHYETDMKAAANANPVQIQSSKNMHKIGLRIGYAAIFIGGSVFIFGKYLESK